MMYRTLGRTGLEVSEISLGSWLTFGGSVGEAASIEVIRRGFDLGVTLFDTADVYAGGRAEEVVGKAIAPLPRDRIVVGTKVFFPMGPDPGDRGLGRERVTEQCHGSLGRLGVDHIDLYQCHRYDPDTPLEETCGAMDELVRAGKIRHWGVSEWTAEQIDAVVALCEREGFAAPETDQPRYSMLERGIESDGVLDACARLGLGVVVFSPLAQGMLTGKYRGTVDPPAGSRAADPVGRPFIERFLTEENLSRVLRLRAIGEDVGLTLAQLALAWVLRRSDVTSAIVGATTREQLEENVGASGFRLEPSVIDRVEDALA